MSDSKTTIPPKADPKGDAPHTYVNLFFAPWLRDHAARLAAISDEISEFEKAMIARAKISAGDVAALFTDTLEYVAQVGAEWRKIAIDTARRAADVAGKA